MYKATVTSKGQLTVPKHVRDHLKLSTGDGLIFRILNDEVKIEKDYGVRKCCVCNGKGIVEYENLILKSCYFCDGTKEIEINKTAWELVASIQWRKYEIAASVLQHESDSCSFNFMQIPKVLLSSEKVPTDLLEQGADYIQMEFLKQFLPRSINNPDKFMIPSKIIVEEIEELLRLSASKSEVIGWFE